MMLIQTSRWICCSLTHHSSYPNTHGRYCVSLYTNTNKKAGFWQIFETTRVSFSGIIFKRITLCNSKSGILPLHCIIPLNTVPEGETLMVSKIRPNPGSATFSSQDGRLRSRNPESSPEIFTSYRRIILRISLHLPVSHPAT